MADRPDMMPSAESAPSLSASHRSNTFRICCSVVSLLASLIRPGLVEVLRLSIHRAVSQRPTSFFPVGIVIVVRLLRPRAVSGFSFAPSRLMAIMLLPPLSHRAGIGGLIIIVGRSSGWFNRTGWVDSPAGRPTWVSQRLILVFRRRGRLAEARWWKASESRRQTGTRDLKTEKRLCRARGARSEVGFAAGPDIGWRCLERSMGRLWRKRHRASGPATLTSLRSSSGPAQCWEEN